MRTKRFQIFNQSEAGAVRSIQCQGAAGFRAGAIAALLAGLCSFLLCGTARADKVFASFQNAELDFSNTGSAATTGLFSAGIPLQVTFQFDENVSGDGVTYLAQEPIKATVTLSSVVADVVTVEGRILDQPLKNGTLEFKDALGHDLLTLSGFTGDVSGFATGSTATLGTDTTLSTLPDVGTYSSDFLKFAPSNSVVESTGLTLDVDGSFTEGANNYLSSFTANADGSFAGDVASVPEPSSLCLAGLATIALLLRRQRSPQPIR